MKNTLKTLLFLFLGFAVLAAIYWVLSLFIEDLFGWVILVLLIGVLIRCNVWVYRVNKGCEQEDKELFDIISKIEEETSK